MIPSASRNVPGKANDEGPRRTNPTPESKSSVAPYPGRDDRLAIAKRQLTSLHKPLNRIARRAADRVGKKRYPTGPPDQPGFLNRGLELRLVPREVKALLVMPKFELNF